MPQLGNGLGLQRFNIIKSYSGILDELGNYDNLVLGISDIRLSKNFSDEWALLKRLSDGDEKWFGFNSKGKVPWNEIGIWREGTGVLKVKHNNQGKNALAYPAYQNNIGYMPEIVVSGVNQVDGAKFYGINDFLTIDDYTDIQIVTPPLTYYSNAIYSTGCNGYLFSKNYNTSNATTYSHNPETTGYDRFRLDNGSFDLQIHADVVTNYMMYWNSLTTNGFNSLNNFLDTLTTTRNTQSINYPNINIGARSNSTDNSIKAYYFKGNIKTIAIFKSDESLNFNNFVNGGI